MQKDLEKAKDVKKSLFDLTTRYEEIQTFFYEQSRLLISKNQEIALLKQEAISSQTMRDAIFANEFATRKEKLRLEKEGMLTENDSLEGDKSSHGAQMSRWDGIEWKPNLTFLINTTY